MACVSLPPKLSERVVRRVVIVFEYRANYIRVNTAFKVKLFPDFYTDPDLPSIHHCSHTTTSALTALSQPMTWFSSTAWSVMTDL